MKDRKPVSHTFTDKHGQFVFGPLCPEKKYEIQIWYNAVKHVKVCEECSRNQECLKGVEIGHCPEGPKPPMPPKPCGCKDDEKDDFFPFEQDK